MNIESIRNYCLAKQAATESFPFDADTLVFKVAGKMFALCSLEKIPLQISLKCDPDYALELREKYPEAVSGAYHMNKKHWNTLQPALLGEQLVIRLIDHSYQLVVAKLPKNIRLSL